MWKVRLSDVIKAIDESIPLVYRSSILPSRPIMSESPDYVINILNEFYISVSREDGEIKCFIHKIRNKVIPGILYSDGSFVDQSLDASFSLADIKFKVSNKYKLWKLVRNLKVLVKSMSYNIILDCQIVNYTLRNIQCNRVSYISVSNKLALIIFTYADINGKRYTISINYGGIDKSPYISFIEVRSLPEKQLVCVIRNWKVMFFFYNIQEGNSLVYDR